MTAPAASSADGQASCAEGGLILEGFAGPGGWSTGLAMAGRAGRVVGVEWDAAACRTARAAGHHRIRADVASFVLPRAGTVEGVILSPPCQAWSRAGKRGGIKDQPRVWEHLARIERAGRWVPYPRDGWHDDRSPLVLEVLRWVLTCRPVWVACEQVPDVLPFWQALVRVLAAHGYDARAGILSAEWYGVPQTRKRAILVAARDGRPVQLPPPTHTAYRPELPDGGRWHGTEPGLFGDALLPWRSMAEALGWAPASVVNTRGARTTPGGNEFSADGPSWALTEKVRSWVLRTGNNSMVTGRTGSRAGDGDVQPYERPVDVPAPTPDTNVGSKWRVTYVNGNQGNAGRRDVAEPAPTVAFGHNAARVQWGTSRPATTGAGDPRIAEPGHRDRAGGRRQFDGDSIRVTIEEAATLQGFPAGYPWQGSRSAQYRQVGDAVPPPLAAAVLTALGIGTRAPSTSVTV